MAITTRAGKGSALSHAELDMNFTDLRDGYAMQIPKTQGFGIKVDSTGTPTFGWEDITGLLITDGYNSPVSTTYRGGIRQLQFQETQTANFSFHIPHDYAIGTILHIHAHWSHNGSNVTGGDVVWAYELTYAKGHGQSAFSEPVLLSGVQTASTIQYRHMLIESAASVSGGSPTQLDTDMIEPDGLIFGRVYLSANNMTVSGGAVPDPFLHQVDIHYQSTAIGTKKRFPSFWG